MTKWGSTPLADICLSVGSGGTPLRKRPDYYDQDGGGHCWVTTKELSDGPIRDTLERISDRGLAESSAKLWPPGTILIAMYAAPTAGRLGRLEVQAATNQAICALEVDQSIVDCDWVFYALQATRQRLVGLAAGVAQQNLNKGHIESFSIPLPPLAEQRIIGSCLRSFDDLIECNRRRIELLEEAARLLYREWFVDFRYPGHEDVPLVDSDLGPIPEGWEASQVEEVMDVVGGGTPSRKQEDYWLEGEIQWYTPSDLTQADSMIACGSGERISDLGLAKSSAKLFPAGSVMMTSRATIGALAISATEACTNQGFITCVPSDRLTSCHIYYWLEAHVPLFLNLASGATFMELRKSTFRDLQIAVPPVHIEEGFKLLVDPLIELVHNLLRQQQVLVCARDLLLPRLVSGDLDISELDLNLEAVG